MANEEATTMTFASEQERASALADIPEAPPSDVIDVDEWQRQMDEKEDRIRNAEIVAKTESDDSESNENQDTVLSQQDGEQLQSRSDSQNDSTPSSDESQQIQQANVEDKDDMLNFNIKRSELPEVLRKYKNPKQIIETIGHARAYADRSEGKIHELNEQLEKLRSQINDNSSLESKISNLEKERDSLQQQFDSTNQTTRQRSQSESKIDKITEKINKLKGMADDEFLTPKDVRDVLADAISEIATTRGTLDDTLNSFSDFKKKAEQELLQVKNEVKGYVETSKRESEKERARKQAEHAIADLVNLQQKAPELNTTKPLSGNDNLEESVVAFCENIADRRLVNDKGGRDYNMINRIINAYIGKHPDIAGRCSATGLTPEKFGLKDNDITAYHLITNAQAHKLGYQINPQTGAWEPFTNVLGEQVRFPDAHSAYNYILDKHGIREQEYYKNLAAAEKKGSESFLKAQQRRDTSPETLGNEGAGDPNNIGESMTEEEAQRIVFQDKRFEEQMEMSARSGDRSLFNMYNKALKRLGMQEELPDKNWPPEQSK